MKKTDWKRISEGAWDLPEKNRPFSTVNPKKRISIENIDGVWNVLMLSKGKKGYAEKSKDFKSEVQARLFIKKYTGI